MIQANELRIGNLISYLGDIVSVSGITKDSEKEGLYYISTKKSGIATNSSFQNVELTEEILLKCGFIPCSIIDNHFNISGMCIWKCNDMFLCDKNGVHIKSLHQLQNLFWCLTGKELNIEL